MTLKTIIKKNFSSLWVSWMELWIFLFMLVFAWKIRKLAISSEGKAVGRNPFRFFTYSRSPIKGCTNEWNRSGTPGDGPSWALQIFNTYTLAHISLLRVLGYRDSTWKTRSILDEWQMRNSKIFIQIRSSSFSEECVFRTESRFPNTLSERDLMCQFQKMPGLSEHL